jgi:hypothetical protein
MRKLDGANGTKALEKAEELQRPETVKMQNNKTTRTKNLFFEKAPTKVRYSRSTSVQKRKKSSSRVEEGSLSLPLSRTNLSFKKRARAKSGESVFLVVGKYHLWYLTLNARYSVTSGRKRGGDRAWCARIFCAGKGGGVFRFLSSRRTSYQSLLVRFGFGRR